MGQALASGLGVMPATRAGPITVGSRTFLLKYGDEYCTDDTAYQQFRAAYATPHGRRVFWPAAYLSACQWLHRRVAKALSPIR